MDLGLGRNGKRKRLTVTVRGTKKDAERRERELLQQRDQGEIILPSKETLGRFLERWLTTIRVEPTTKQRYAGIVQKYWTPVLGHLALSAVREYHIAEAENRWLAGRLSSSSVVQHHAVLHRALKMATRWRLLVSNPMEGMERPKLHQKPGQAFDLDQLDTFLRAIDGHPYALLFRLAVRTGMRIGEILGLTWSSVKLDASKAHLTQQWNANLRMFKQVKGHRAQWPVDLDEELVSELRQARKDWLERRLRAGAAWQDHDLVFCTDIGNVQSYSSVYHAFKRLLQAHGLPADFRLHDLRHTHFTHLLEDGTGVNTVQQRAGHATPAFTLARYGHSLPGSQKAAAERFAAANRTRAAQRASAER